MNELFSTISTKCYELANTVYTSIGSPNPSPYLKGIWDNFLSAMTTISSYFSWSEREVTHKKKPQSPTTQAVDEVGNNTITPSQEEKATDDDCSELHPIERDIAKEYERMLNDLPNKSRRLLSELLIIAEARQEELNSNMLRQLIQSLKLLLDPNTALDNQIVDERRILSDGNCLFNAVLGGLHDHGLQLDSDHMTLRLMAITHLRKQLEINPDDTASFLVGAIMVYQDAKRESLELDKIFLQNHLLECEAGEKEQIKEGLRQNEADCIALQEFSTEQYLELAEKAGFFCGEAELRALDEILEDVTIHVHNRESPLINSYGHGDRAIHILYNGRDHYDRYLVAE